MNSVNNFMDMVTGHVTFSEGIPIIADEHDFPLTLSQQILKAVKERPDDYENVFDDLINEFGREKVYMELYLNLRGEDMNFVNGVLSVTASGALRLSNHVHNLIKEHCKSRKELADSYNLVDDKDLFDMDDEAAEFFKYEVQDDTDDETAEFFKCEEQDDTDDETAEFFKCEEQDDTDDEAAEFYEDEDEAQIDMDDEIVEFYEEDDNQVDMDDEVAELADDDELYNYDDFYGSDEYDEE